MRPEAGLPSITFSLLPVLRAEVELSTILPGLPLHELALPWVPGGHTFPTASSLITWRSEVGLPFILLGSLLTRVRPEAGLPSITFSLLHVLRAEVELPIFPKSPELGEDGVLW